MLQLQESGWRVVEWLDYFSELVALRTCAAHWTGLVGAAGCSCTIYISTMEGGDRQSQAHPLPLPSLISLVLPLSPSHTLLWKRSFLQASRPLPFFLSSFFLCSVWCIPTNPTFHLQRPFDTFCCSYSLLYLLISQCTHMHSMFVCNVRSWHRYYRYDTEIE